MSSMFVAAPEPGRPGRHVPRHGPVAWYLYALAGCLAVRAAALLILP